MGKFADLPPWSAGQEQVDAAHEALVEKVPYAAFVSAVGLKHKGDKIHFDSPSFRELGKRYAEAILNLQKAK